MNQEVVLTVLFGTGIALVGLGFIILTHKLTVKYKIDQRNIDTFRTKVYSLEAEDEALKLLMKDHENARSIDT